MNNSQFTKQIAKRKMLERKRLPIETFVRRKSNV